MLAERLGCTVEGDPDLLLTGISTIEDGNPDQLTFLANPRYRKYLPDCRAGAIIIKSEDETPAGITRIVSTDPYRDLQAALTMMYGIPEPETAFGISPTAVVHTTAVIGKEVMIGTGVEVGASAVIGDGCSIGNWSYIGTDAAVGKGCRIGLGAVIRRDVTLGNRVVIGDGTVVGYDGFGYAPDETGYHKILQIGTVVIEDDVEIGANCCIDRAAVGETRIGRGSKLDNLIQVAHGVHIGENTVIAAQTGISGSTRIGSRAMIGGQAGLGGHIEIGDDMIIGAQAGVTKSVDIKGVVSGYPARPHGEALRRDANVSRIPKLMKIVKILEAKVEKLLNGSSG